MSKLARPHLIPDPDLPDSVSQPQNKSPQMDRQEIDKTIAEMNQVLRRANEQNYKSHPEPVHPLVFIIGVPRSGTTLLSQLVSLYLNVSYINNLVASFWSAPLYGIALSKKVLGGAELKSSFRSQFGQTQGIGEPHEYGYFWKELFGYDMRFQPSKEIETGVDWQRVRMVLRNLSDAFGTAVVFKYLPLCWHLTRLKEAVPEALFVRVHRDPLESARSLIGFRVQEFCSKDYMASLIPEQARALEDSPYWVQVAGQVFYLNRILDEQIAEIPSDDVIECSYEDICGQPRWILNKVASLLAERGYPAKLESDPPPRFDLSSKRLDATLESCLRKSVEEFYETSS